MAAGYLIQAVLAGVVALALVVSSPSWLIYLLAAVLSSMVTLSRPGLRAWLPELTTSPTELTGANAIGFPGWPLFAFCTASIESVRMVLIDSCSMLAVETDMVLLSVRRFSSMVYFSVWA